MPVDPGATLLDSEARHLLRRAGLGPDQRTFDLIAGGTRGAAADRLLDFKPKSFKPGGSDLQKLHDKWVNFILKSKAPLQAKLALFWHDHFSVGFTKVQSTYHMARYVAVLHLFANGNFKDFVKTMGRTAAMMEFLDTVRNEAEIPNENYARELMELFTLGVKDYATPPQDNYTQDDIVQIARAFSGWRYDDRSRAYLDDSEHDFVADFPARGPKTIFQSTGGFGGAGRDFDDQGEGAQEIDRVVDILFDHVDSTGKNTVARRTARRLLEYFAYSDPTLALVDQTVGTGGTSFDTTWDIAAMVRRIFVSDEFFATAEAPGPGTKKSIKWPIDQVVSTLRLLGMKPKGKELIFGNTTVADAVQSMGQILLEPPSVFGWDWENAWMSSTTMRARAEFARDVSTAQNGGTTSFDPSKLVDVGLSNAGQIVDAATDRLGITDQLASADRDALIAYLTDGGPPSTPIDLGDSGTRRVKLNGLFGLLLMAPAFQVH